MVAGVCLLVLSVIEKEKMGQKTTIVLWSKCRDEYKIKYENCKTIEKPMKIEKFI